MKMISYFLSLVYVLFLILTFIVTSNGKRLTYASAKANADFVNIIVNNVTPINVQLGQKQIRCLKSCMDHASCMSFFYNFLSTECRHFGVDFTDPGVGVSENGWKYYTVVRDCRINGYACPTSTGYTFFADICFCYKYVGTKSTHWQAKQYCANIKGYLVKINRKLKQREMERLLKVNITADGRGKVMKTKRLLETGLLHVELLDVGLLGVGLMACRTAGVSDEWGVGLMGCRNIGAAHNDLLLQTVTWMKDLSH